MNKTELAQAIARTLDANKVKKSVRLQKHVIQLTDITYSNEESAGKITVRPRDKEVKYTCDDIEYFLNAMISVFYDVLSRGESITIQGIGIFKPRRWAGRVVKMPDTGEYIDVPDRYNLKFYPSMALREAMITYTSFMNNNPVGLIIPDPVYDQFETPDEEDEEGDVYGYDAAGCSD